MVVLLRQNETTTVAQLDLAERLGVACRLVVDTCSLLDVKLGDLAWFSWRALGPGGSTGAASGDLAGGHESAGSSASALFAMSGSNTIELGGIDTLAAFFDQADDPVEDFEAVEEAEYGFVTSRITRRRAGRRRERRRGDRPRKGGARSGRRHSRGRPEPRPSRARVRRERAKRPQCKSTHPLLQPGCEGLVVDGVESGELRTARAAGGIGLDIGQLSSRRMLDLLPRPA